MAHELQRCGLPYRVLERQVVGYSWLNHYERLHLHIPKQVSSLPDQPMPATYPQYPSALQFRHYLARYAEQQRLAHETGGEGGDAVGRGCWGGCPARRG